MRSVRTMTFLSSLALLSCASSRPTEKEPADPPEEVGTPGEVAAEEPGSVPLALEGSACPNGKAPLAVKLFVLLRHPTDPVPALPEAGFALTVDGRPAAAGVRVGQVHTLCVEPGEHEVAVSGGTATRAIRATAPGTANLAVAGGDRGPAPDLPPGRTAPETPPSGTSPGVRR